jgi:hypothetical protein
MAKGLRRKELKKYKGLWEQTVSEKRRHMQYPPAVVKENIYEKVDGKGKMETRIQRETYYEQGLAPRRRGASRLLNLLFRKSSTGR